jgi:hypothetical protein
MNEARYELGIADALADISANRCRLFWQTRGTWAAFFTSLMAERFGIRVVHVSDLTIESQRSFESGYNSTIEAHVNGIHGVEAFELALREVHEYRAMIYRQSPTGAPAKDANA